MKVGGGSYLSSHDPRMVLGIGKRAKIDWLEIKWPQPSGAVQRFTDLPIDRYITIREGQPKVGVILYRREVLARRLAEPPFFRARDY